MAKSSTPPSPTPTATPARPDKNPARFLRRNARRILIGILGLLAILFIVFLLLPQWISNDQGRLYILQKLNSRFHGTVNVAEWSFSWFHGSELSGVTLKLPDGSTPFACTKIHSDLTLWNILRGNYDLGTTTIDGLQLSLAKDSSGQFNASQLSTFILGPTRIANLTHTLRGSLQFSSASITLSSQTTQQSITYSEAKGAITIASRDAPFHVQFAASGLPGTLSLNATFPPMTSWPNHFWATNLAGSDFEFSAVNIPTSLLCDLLSLDPEYSQSIGDSILSASASNHSSPTLDGNIFTIKLMGSHNNATLDATLLVQPATPQSPTLLSLPPNSPTYHASADLALSRPLIIALTHINPLFQQLQSTTNPIHFSINTLNLYPHDLPHSTAAARILFPPMTFLHQNLLAQLLPNTTQPTLSATADPLRVRLENNALISDPLTFTFNRRDKILLQGDISLDGKINFLATIPLPDPSSLSTGTQSLPITGTLDNPLLTLPQ